MTCPITKDKHARRFDGMPLCMFCNAPFTGDESGYLDLPEKSNLPADEHALFCALVIFGFKQSDAEGALSVLCDLRTQLRVRDAAPEPEPEPEPESEEDGFDYEKRSEP